MKSTNNFQLKSALLMAGLALPLLASQPVKAATTSFDASNFTGDPLKVNVVLNDNNGNGTVTVTVNVVTDAQNPNTADLRGFFFDFAESGITGLTATGAQVSATNFGGNVSSVGNANLNGAGGQASYDGAIEIGNNGLRGGSDDFQTTTFTLSANQPLTLAMFSAQSIGVRATSVGLPGGRREGSSKTDGSVPTITASSGSTGGSTGGTVDTGSTVTPPAPPAPPSGGTVDPGTTVTPPAPPSGGGTPAEQVPEPTTIIGSIMGLAGLMGMRRKAKANKTEE